MIKLSVKTTKQTTLPCPFVHSHSSYTWGIPRTENIFMESAAELTQELQQHSPLLQNHPRETCSKLISEWW